MRGYDSETQYYWLARARGQRTLSTNEARTARASRDGTAFFAVAPRKRPASAHSPRTGLTRKVKICSPSSRDRVSSWLLGLVAVLRAHRQALFHEPSRLPPDCWQLRAMSGQAAKETCARPPKPPSLRHEDIRPCTYGIRWSKPLPTSVE